MNAVRRTTLAVMAAGLVAVGCTSITIPSIPPIPTIPPGFSIPPINLPSGLLPSVDPGTGLCVLVTPQEITSIMGETASITSGDAQSCTYTLASFATVVLATSSDTDMTGPRFLFGESARDLTVGGFPAISGVAIGQPAVYVQRPNGQLSVLGVLTGSDQATIDKLVQVANTAIARLP